MEDGRLTPRTGVEAVAGGWVDIPSDALEALQALYDRSLMLQAYAASRAYGPLSRWAGRAAVLAGRLASNLGAERLGQVIHWRAWRLNRRDPELAAFRAHALLHRRGPLAAWRFLEAYDPLTQNVTPQGLAHWLSVRATVAAALRDFEAAWAFVARGQALTPNDPWLATVEAGVLEQEDRYAEALAAARRSLELRPWNRPGVQATAHALQLHDRDEEALALLAEAGQRLESVHVTAQLAVLQLDLGRHAEAAESLDRYEALAPLMEREEREWLRSQRVRLACHRKDYGGALRGAREMGDPYHEKLAQRIEAGGPWRQARWEVPFVRQHHLTCAPATLSAIGAYWRLPVDHLEVTEAICYDGTPATSERHWAETHGWVVREFTVTASAAMALLDRGVPFTLTTSGVTSSHLQAVVGYDDLRQTLWIRDPFVYFTREFLIEPLLERHCSTGPRGMALVPVAERGRLEGLELPDAGLYDQLFGVQRALMTHQRAEAVQRCDALQATAPGHRLTLTALRALAQYDENTPVLLGILEALLALYPDDGGLHLARLACLNELARREDRLQALSRLAAARDTDPIFWRQYALELQADGREARAAATWVQWGLRYRPTDPDLLAAWAGLLWDQQEFAEASRYYRLAACLGDRREPLAWSYFLALRHLRRTEEGLEFLRRRYQRLGGRSGGPAITLIEALQRLDRSAEAFETLEAALRRRPQDGELRLFAADIQARFGRAEPARHALEQAKPQVSRAAWHRAAAALAGYRSDKVEAVQCWREVLSTEPLAHDAIGALARLLAETERREAALQFLDDLCQRFPCSGPLLRLRVQWLLEDDPAGAGMRLRQLLEINPADAWAWRELALLRSRTNCGEEALAAANEAIRLEPRQTAGFCTRGDVQLRLGRIEEGRADLRQAVQLEVDNGYALVHYVASGRTPEERRQALEFVAGELRRQVILSDALTAYRDAARGLLPPAEVLGLLREAHAARPDLWQSWSVLIQQLVELGEHTEALALATRATEQFPLQARLRVDLAGVEQARLNPSGEIAALEQALGLNPAYTHAARLLAGVYGRRDELPQARAVLERAIVAAPLDAFNHGCLADVVWKSGDRERALALLEHALRLEPGYDWAWATFDRWTRELDRPDRAVELARDLTRRRAGEARSWLRLAACLTPARAADELSAALDQALILNPRCVDAFDRRATVLAETNRFDEALQACAPPVLTEVPAQLRLRAAWIEAQRGNLARAIERAKSALTDHPEFYAGWQLLSDWYVEAQQLDAAVQAAERMATLAPLDAVPLGYVANLKLRLGDRSGAKAALQRAFSLEPEYEYAGQELFHLQLADAELNGAEQTLAILERRGANPRCTAARVRLAAARSQLEEASRLFGRLCEEAAVTEHSLSLAADALEERMPRRRVERLIEQALARPAPPPVLAEWWVERQTARRRWGLHSRLDAWHTQGEVGRRAILRYLDCLGRALQEASQRQDITRPIGLRWRFRRLLRKHRGWLRDDVEGWGKVGYVLSCIGRPRPVVEWLGEWRRHPQAASWMLYNLVLMLYRLRRHDEAFEIIRHAVGLRHHEELYEVFVVWAAFEEAVRGNPSRAQALVDTLPPGSVRERCRPVLGMARLLIELDPGLSTEPRQAVFKRVQATLRECFGRVRPVMAEAVAREGYRRCLRRVLTRGGGLPLWLWGHWFYRRDEWLVLPVLMVLLPLALAVPPVWFFWWRLWRRFRPS